MKILKSKRGTMPDKIYGLFLVAFIIVLVIAYGTAWAITQPIIRGLGGSYTEAAMDKLEPASVNLWLDWTIILLYFAINIVVCLVLPLTVENNPILFGVLAFIMLLLVLPIALLSNSLVAFIQSFAPSYTMTIFLLEHLVLLEVVFMLLMIFILLFKGKSPTATY